MGAADAQVLVIETDAASGVETERLLAGQGFSADVVIGGRAARRALEKRSYALALAELRLPDEDGMDLLRALSEEHDDMPVVVLSAEDVDSAVRALGLGAADYVLKPVEAQQLAFVVRKVLTLCARAERPPEDPTRPNLLGEATAMVRLREQIDRAAAVDATVLLRGETGTGKDVVARIIHGQSKRGAAALVKVHCAALPESLLESELFGYEKGAFTGATCRKPGRVELADGGTLFLDEIGDITPATQVKLLRLLQDREYERLGGVSTLRADVRIICATHRDLEGLIKKGSFREDLFYRLNVLPLWLPPLRARRADVPLLARAFCESACAAHHKTVTLDAAALDRLRNESWPGNVRELHNFVERLVVLGDKSALGAADIARELTASAPFPTENGSAMSTGISVPGEVVAPLDEAVRAAERRAIERALVHTRNNKKLAARLLGVSRGTLYNKLLEHGMI